MPTPKYTIHPSDRPGCFSAHMGLWMIEPDFMTRAVSAVLAGLSVTPQAHAGVSITTATQDPATGCCITDSQAQAGGGNTDTRPYQVIGGLAIVDLCGPMTKAGSEKFGEASTIGVRHQLRQAESDDEVQQIALRITSPGGHVAGTQELANEVGRINAIKPITACIEDIGASAAYWVASQASRITANQLAEVGSIGTFAVLYDTSEAYAREGVKVHVVSTGPSKGAGTPGTEITEAVLEGVQGKIDDINAVFLTAVGAGRDMTPEAVADVATGSTWLAARALDLGLIDSVQSTEETISEIIQSIQDNAPRQSARAVSRFKVLQAQSRAAAIQSTIF